MSNNTTPKIVMFTKTTAATVTNEIIAALEAVAEKYGLEVSIPSDTYDGTSVTAKVKLSIVGKKLDYNALGLTDFPPFGTQFTIKGINYKVVEHFPGKARYQVLGLADDGSKGKFTLQAVTEALENGKEEMLSEARASLNESTESFPAEDAPAIQMPTTEDDSDAETITENTTEGPTVVVTKGKKGK